MPNQESATNGTENTRKTAADVAHFYRALGRAGADGMPMPFEVHVYTTGYHTDSAMLRYRTVEDVDAAAAYVGGRAGHDDFTHQGKRTWHSYGTDEGGGRSATWTGWTVRVWAAVDGPSPEAAVES